MTIERIPLTNGAYGFPRAHARRIRPVALVCIHVTGNRRTAAMADTRAAALAERSYANRAGSNGPSAHDYDSRRGLTIRAIDPLRFAAWSNGDVASPDTDNAGIRRVLAFRAKGYNVNEAYWLETEEVGDPTVYPITSAQRHSIALRIADISKRVGLAISRDTVHGHWQINGVDRRNCPVRYGERHAFIADIVARAQIIANAPQLWGSDVPDSIREIVHADAVAIKLRTLHVRFGTRINMIDLEAALARAGIDYGTSVQAIDVRALMRR